MSPPPQRCMPIEYGSIHCAPSIIRPTKCNKQGSRKYSSGNSWNGNRCCKQQYRTNKPTQGNHFKHQLYQNTKINPTKAIGSFSETAALMLAKIRCGDHFSLVRFGDGEFFILSNKKYHELDSWNFSGNKTEGTEQIQAYMKDAFQLAVEGGIYLGLPIFFCTEGSTSPLGIRVGGGGNPMFYNPYRDTVLPDLPLKQIVHSWQWGNLNYPRLIDLLNIIADIGKKCIVIFGEDLKDEMLKRQLKWIWGALTVPADGYVWLEADPSGIVASATDAVFIFSAGPITNVLIPAMTRANSKNSYIDVGGALTMELAGKSTRDFHDSYVRAGGALQKDQTCTESRWNLDGTPVSKKESTVRKEMPEVGNVRKRPTIGGKLGQKIEIKVG